MTDITNIRKCKITKKYLKIPKITTFKNDRGFASESKVYEGCNEQSNEIMGVCPLNRLTTTVVDYKDEDEREDDLCM